MVWAFAATATFASSSFTALKVPEHVRVTSSLPRQIVWSGLSEKEKNLVTHLLAAAQAGKLITFSQTHRHALTVKAILESSLRAENSVATSALLGQPAYEEFLNYAAKFEDLTGPYESSNRKYVLSKVTAPDVEELFKKAVPKMSELDR